MQSSPAAVRVLVLDEQEVVRRGVRHALDGAAGITVVAEAASAAEALARGSAVRPDVAVVGMRLPDGDGAHACASLRGAVPGLRCLVLSMDSDPDTVAAAMQAGVAGYLVKHVRAAALVAAVRTVAAGGTVFGREVTASIAGGSRGGAPEPLGGLTLRERQMLWLIGEGLTNRQIGERLGVTEKTVKNYTGHLLSKLGMQRRTQVAILATHLRDLLGEGPGPSAAAGLPPLGSRAPQQGPAGDPTD
ncbi:response regulator transcription factor [Geodermatophilus sp. SYSU D01036]